MRSSQRAGSNSGVDYATVVMFLLWIALTIVLVVVLFTRGSAADAVRLASRHASKVPCAGFRHKRRNQVVNIDTLQRITESAWQPDEGLGFDASPTPVETIEERILTKDAN